MIDKMKNILINILGTIFIATTIFYFCWNDESLLKFEIDKKQKMVIKAITIFRYFIIISLIFLLIFSFFNIIFFKIYLFVLAIILIIGILCFFIGIMGGLLTY